MEFGNEEKTLIGKSCSGWPVALPAGLVGRIVWPLVLLARLFERIAWPVAPQSQRG